MIGHDDIIVQNDMWKMFRNIQPTFFHHSSRRVQYHFAVDDFTKQTRPTLTTNGNKIQSVARIIVSAQPYRTTVMFVGTIFRIYGHIWVLGVRG